MQHGRPNCCRKRLGIHETVARVLGEGASADAVDVVVDRAKLFERDVATQLLVVEVSVLACEQARVGP